MWALGCSRSAASACTSCSTLLEPVRPVRLAGFLGSRALLAAALYGGQFQILLAAVAVVPVLFALTRRGPAARATTLAMAATLLGVYWIGFALAHAVLLRELPHGDAIVIDVLVGTFIGDTGAYLGGRAFGRARSRRASRRTRRSRGSVIGDGRRRARGLVAGPIYQDWSRTDALLLGVGVAIAAPIGDLFESFVKRDVGIKDTGSRSAPTAARSTASTPRCSPCGRLLRVAGVV